ncbi:hypothetical protein ACFX2I_020204 [Malus domestica]
MELVHRSIDFDYVFNVPSRRSSRGQCSKNWPRELGLLWREEVNVSILSSSISHIDTQVDYLEALFSILLVSMVAQLRQKDIDPGHCFQSLGVGVIFHGYAWAILMSVDGRSKRFCFEEMWVQREGCEEVLGTLSGQRHMFRDIKNEISVVWDKLGTLFEQPYATHTLSRHTEVMEKLDPLLSCEETYWRQRSRTTLLKEREIEIQNGSIRRHRIGEGILHLRVRDSSGVWQEFPGGIKDTVLEYFFNIFKSQGVFPNALHSMLEAITPSVFVDVNANLLAPIMAEEIECAVFHMHSSKSPGPNWVSSLFNQKFWHMVGDEVIEVVRSFFTSAVHDYAYSHIQSAFVSGRLISDNSLLVAEVGHFLHNKRSGRDGFLALNLDLSKAYDRAEWGFLEAMLKCLGFTDAWGLSALISKKNRDDSLHGLHIADSAPSLNHMLFVDDSFLFTQATMEECEVIQHILDVYS